MSGSQRALIPFPQLLDVLCEPHAINELAKKDPYAGSSVLSSADPEKDTEKELATLMKKLDEGLKLA